MTSRPRVASTDQWLAPRWRIRRGRESIPSAPIEDLRTAMAAVLDVELELIEAALRHTDAEWLNHRAQGGALIVEAATSRLSHP
jgi:hypothetical protein